MGEPRIAVGAASHESNTFTPLETTLDDFDVHRSEELLDPETVGANSSLAGIVETLRDAGSDVVPTLSARALPSGVVELDTYDTIKRGIVEGVRDVDDLDGICLALHGSMYVECEPDPEGDLLSTLRGIVGPDVPIVCALDMHATMSSRVVHAADGFVGYRTAPHTDTYETGVRAAELLLRALREDVTLTMGWSRAPFLVTGERSETDTPPMSDMIAALEEADQRDGVWSTSYLLTHSWADTPHAGVSGIAVGPAVEQRTLAETARELACEFWNRREEFDFTTEARPFDDVVDEALAESGRPVVVGDAGDIPSAGSTVDVTYALDRLLARGIEDVLVAVVVDPEAVDACRDARASPVDLSLGQIEPGGPPLDVSAEVVSVETVDGVRSAVVRVDGVTVVVTDERTTAHNDPVYLDALGLSPREFALVVLKSGYLAPAWKELAHRRMLALTPGYTNQIYEELDWTEVARPVYPLDPDATWWPCE